MSILSIDLAHRSYADVGVCALRSTGERIEVCPFDLSTLGLGRIPTPIALAKAVTGIAEDLGAQLIFLDGPQAWKSPSNGLQHSRVCERQLATQGKTGLPGVTKPAGYAPFIAFSIAVFDHLAELGWPRLHDEASLSPARRLALESFPSSAWRTLQLKPLPGKANTGAGVVESKLGELRALSPISVPTVTTHDELQAIVAGLAGIAVEGHPRFGYTLAGVAPFQLEGFWREGFIVNPTRAT